MIIIIIRRHPWAAPVGDTRGPPGGRAAGPPSTLFPGNAGLLHVLKPFCISAPAHFARRPRRCTGVGPRNRNPTPTFLAAGNNDSCSNKSNKKRGPRAGGLDAYGPPDYSLKTLFKKRFYRPRAKIP